MLNISLLVLLIAINIADLVTTLKGLKRDDTTEANPLMGRTPKLFAGLLAKGVMVGLGIAAVLVTPPTAWALLLPLDLFGVVVIYNNVRALQGKDTIF